MCQTMDGKSVVTRQEEEGDYNIDMLNVYIESNIIANDLRVIHILYRNLHYLAS